MKAKSWRWWLGLLLFSFFLWFLDGLNLLNWFKNPVDRLSLPIRAKFYKQKVVSYEDSPADTLLSAEAARLNQENERLRDLLGAPLSPRWQFIPADVVSLDGNNLTLHAGSLSGIKAGKTVFAYLHEDINNGVVLGQVTTVSQWQSQVGLLYSPEILVKAVTLSGAKGVVQGDSQNIWLNDVLQKSRLLPGEIVTTVGGDGWLPGLVLGRINEVLKEDTAVFQRAKLSPVIDPRSLVNVFVVSD